MNKPFHRNKFITNYPAQLKIISILLISILVPVLFVGSFLYFFIFKVFSEQQNVSGYMPIALNSAIMKTNLAVVICIIPLLLLLFVWGVIVSNRITGPLQRLQRELDEMDKSSVITRLHTRENDYMKPLVESLNKLLSKQTHQ